MINLLDSLLFPFLDCVEVQSEAVDHLVEGVAFSVVQRESDWHVVEDISLGCFTSLQHVLIQKVLLTQGAVVLKMVHKVLLAVFAQEFVLNLR